jgi:iron(III) transport system substrate-binding protein
MSKSRWFAPLLAMGFAAAAHAQDIDAVMRLPDEARMKALVEGAKKEGEVMVYHSTQTEDLRPVFDAFSKRYGIKVRDWRSSSGSSSTTTW